MTVTPRPEGPVWGQQWRSSPVFIVTAMAMVLFTDTLLCTFIVPILPYMVEYRLGLDPDYTQRMSLALLSQGSFVSIIAKPLISRHTNKSGNQQTWLLIALVVCLVSTAGLALATSGGFQTQPCKLSAANYPLTTSAAVISLARFIQALAGSVMCEVAFSTIADNVNPEYLGKTHRVISVVVSVGTSAGAMLSGVLFDLGGYWVAWFSAFMVVMVNIVIQSFMPEQSKDKGKKPIASKPEDHSPSETSPLLPVPEEVTMILRMREGIDIRGYTTLLRHRRFVAGTLSYLAFAILTTSFDTTLPLHVRDVFGWGSMPTGLLFMALQSPGIALGPLLAWMKDRLGSRHPVAIGFLLLAPLVWLVGVPGDGRFPWANEDNRGPVLYSVAVMLIGVTACALNGAGTMEATAAVDEIESKKPGIFGPDGGYLRALSISNMSWTVGSFLGPVLSGSLVEQAGYYEMCRVLAVICFASSINAYVNLGAAWDPGLED